MKNTFEVKKILIPIDFSKTAKLALEHAAHLCKKFGSDLHLLHVFTSSSVSVLPNLKATSASSGSDNDIKNLLVEELDKIGQKFHSQYNVGYNIEVREGSIVKEISNVANEVKADMIVMGTHGASGFEEFFIGSSAYKVVTSSPLPVLTIQEHSNKLGYDNIVLPIDNTIHTRDKVAEAAFIAKAFSSTIHIVSLVKDEDKEDEAIFNLKVKQIEEYLDHRDIKHISKTLHGNDIAQMTLDYAEEVKADLTVVMTDQENYTGFFVGPYAQIVVNHSKIPVLSITPIGIVEGFSQRFLGGDYKPFSL